MYTGLNFHCLIPLSSHNSALRRTDLVNPVTNHYILELNRHILNRIRKPLLERFLTQRPNAPREDLAYLMERLDQPIVTPVPIQAANAA